MTTSFEKHRVLTLVATAAWLMPTIAHAQPVSKPNVKPKGAHEVLAIFEKRAKSGEGDAPDQVLYPKQYPRVRVDSVIDGLERLALTAESEDVARSAAAAVASAGATKRGMSGILDRTLRIYKHSSSLRVRATIVHFMRDQGDRDRAIAFLRSVAAQDSEQQDFDGAPFLAAMALSEMGVEGRSVLSELRQKRLLRDERTAGFVDWFLDKT